MTKNNAAQTATQHQLSDEYVNAVIRQHGYQSPEAVTARLYQWIGLHGGENGVTLLMYEAHKALSKLRGPVADTLPLEKVLHELVDKIAPGLDTGDLLQDARRASTLLGAIMASAPVAGEPFMYGIMGPDGKAHFEEFCVSGDRSELQAEVVDHLNRDNPEDGTYSVVALFRDAAPEARPSDDALWDQTLTERDEYHDMADKLANAIADHLLVEIGEHSSSNCPWMRALEAIENAAPQASEADVMRQAIKTCGTKVIKALAAIARANGPDTRRGNDPELIYRSPVMDEVVRIRQAYDELNAALSAQPGAQKEQSDV